MTFAEVVCNEDGTEWWVTELSAPHDITDHFSHSELILRGWRGVCSGVVKSHDRH